MHKILYKILTLNFLSSVLRALVNIFLIKVIIQIGGRSATRKLFKKFYPSITPFSSHLKINAIYGLH